MNNEDLLIFTLSFLLAPCFFIDWHHSLSVPLISHWPLHARWGLPCTLCFSYHSAQVSFALFGFPGMPLAFSPFLLCMVYAHVPVCTRSTYLCAHVPVCTEAEGQCHMSCSTNFAPISLVQGLSQNRQSHWQSTSPPEPPVFASHHAGSIGIRDYAQLFSVGSGHLNTGSYAYVTVPLPTELLPSPTKSCFLHLSLNYYSFNQRALEPYIIHVQFLI